MRGDIFGRERGRQVARGSGAPLTGSYGRAAPPKVRSFVVSDPEQRDGSGAGDAYTIGFDIPTNRGHFDPTANASLGRQVSPTPNPNPNTNTNSNPEPNSNPNPTPNTSLGRQYDNQHGMGYVGNWTSAGGMGYVGSLFAFSQPLGTNYSGA